MVGMVMVSRHGMVGAEAYPPAVGNGVARNDLLYHLGCFVAGVRVCVLVT